jgi:hypothetical protein
MKNKTLRQKKERKKERKSRWTPSRNFRDEYLLPRVAWSFMIISSSSSEMLPLLRSALR